MTKYHAVLYMYNDLPRAEFVIQGMQQNNPHIPLTVYNGGEDMSFLKTKYNINLVQGRNLWTTDTRHPPGAFNYDWFVSFFDFAKKYDPDYLIFLETDVKVNKKIEIDPTYDVAGPIFGCGFMERYMLYDFWGCYLNGLPFEEDRGSRWPHKLHTGMGGTAYSRNFFRTCEDRLSDVKKCYDMLPLCGYHDVIISCLARMSGCTLGDWAEASDIRGTERIIDNMWVHDSDYNKCALIHNFKV